MTDVLGAGVFVPEAAMLNSLINGGFDFAQRTGGVLASIDDAEYGPDRWKCFTESDFLQYTREDATAIAELNSRYNGRWDKITAADKFMVGQPIEGVNTVPLRGRKVRFQAMLRANANVTMRMALLELQAAGAMDTIPDEWVTAWGAPTVDPTLGANMAIIDAAESKSVTNTFAPFSVDAVIPDDSENVIAAIWSDSAFATSDDFEMAEAGVYVQDAPRIWVPRLVQPELAMCQRYYAKTFAQGTAPAQNTEPNSALEVNSTGAVAFRSLSGMWRYPVSMRVAPLVITYNPGAANANWRNLDTAADVGVKTAGATSESIQIVCNPGPTDDSRHIIHLTADAEL